MKIYTRRGDEGLTSLIGGKRVAKNDLRIESYGTVDELNSFIGLLRDYPIDDSYKTLLIEIQDRLFTMGSLLAEQPEGSKMDLPQVEQSDIDLLENEMDKLDAQLPPMRNFVLPGGHLAVSTAHVCRTVCRRAERLVTALNKVDELNPIILAYLNRLSDYLFVLSRKLSVDFNAEEIVWKPRV